MRKAQMRQVLDFIESLRQAHEEIESAMDRKNLILAQNMLGECQQFAVSFGENLERMEGEGHITVSYVEDTVILQPLVILLVLDQAVLHHLAHAGGELFLRKG